MAENEKVTEQYRDKIATVDKQGKRIWVYPKKPEGPLHRWRVALSVFLLALLFGAPFITINNKPLVLLDIINRNFIIFGVRFWPQDIHLFVLGTIALIVFIVLFTIIFGRVWCGWACPQTIFMEMIFRKIEYWIEGDAGSQRKLNAAPMTAEKFLKKFSKHIIFYGIAFLIGNTFLAYIVGKDELFRIISAPPSEHFVGFTAMVLFSLVFYWVFAFFREQVCTLVCPYGRLQGVLLDKKSIVVAYDFNRGEPRGKRTKATEKDFGDCIDCNKCVDVCPTGIDIRNGTQLECINCTACIDACNEIMQKVNKPKGLIRYDSYDGLKTGQPLKVSPRMIGYSSVLVVILSVLVILLMTRTPVETTILRTPGVMYQERDDGTISNLYNLKIVNKTFEQKNIVLNLKSPQGEIEVIGGDITVSEGNLGDAAFFVMIPKDKLKFANTPLIIEVFDGNELLEEIKTNFIGPNPFQKK